MGEAGSERPYQITKELGREELNEWKVIDLDVSAYCDFITFLLEREGGKGS
jgi:hypothetical protein